MFVKYYIDVNEHEDVSYCSFFKCDKILSPLPRSYSLYPSLFFPSSGSPLTVTVTIVHR